MNISLFHGAARVVLKSGRKRGFIDSVVTSPPYFQKRKYLAENHPLRGFEIGRERSLSEYVEHLAGTFQDLIPWLKPTATIFVNIGDTFRNGCSLSVPWEFKRAMQARGFQFVQELPWIKSYSTDDGNVGSSRPESAKRRFTVGHEYVLLFVLDQKKYFLDKSKVSVPLSGVDPKNPQVHVALKSMGGNAVGNYGGVGKKKYIDHGAEDPSALKRRILSRKMDKMLSGDFTASRRAAWFIPTPNSTGENTAQGPERLFEICIQSGSPEKAVILDPFMGPGTVGRVCLRNGRSFVGIDIDESMVQEFRDYVMEAGAGKLQREKKGTFTHYFSNKVQERKWKSIA
ncbi:site-specific DNA-methyltransferase [Leptospira langatensis]|uniref:Methyltransferase n=1 Tax=Leptospira langatensis TaxID=2484983 RepID=A0A5R2ATL3_9LEPT|nr:site-specific DNA-methyltransferase [Leptospira langatensis]TGJ99892.1 site-specific DNA-methyltransferase [Leptospira langatensis]